MTMSFIFFPPLSCSVSPRLQNPWDDFEPLQHLWEEPSDRALPPEIPHSAAAWHRRAHSQERRNWDLAISFLPWAGHILLQATARVGERHPAPGTAPGTLKVPVKGGHWYEPKGHNLAHCSSASASWGGCVGPWASRIFLCANSPPIYRNEGADWVLWHTLQLSNASHVLADSQVCIDQEFWCLGVWFFQHHPHTHCSLDTSANSWPLRRLS